MSSLFFRNLFFTILQPGIVVVLVPYLIIREKIPSRFSQPFEWNQFSGIIIFIVGLIILLACIIRFPSEGKGTISPLDPTKKLVVNGLYKYSRNPMYVGAILCLIGISVFFNSSSLWIYTLAVFIGFHIFILLHEEPRLIKDFGEEYLEYRKQIRRWL